MDLVPMHIEAAGAFPSLQVEHAGLGGQGVDPDAMGRAFILLVAALSARGAVAHGPDGA
jgi:hypothetical protein